MLFLTRYSTLIGSGWRAAGTPVITLGLHALHHLQNMAQPYMVNHRTLIDLRQSVVELIGKGGAISTQLNMAVRTFVDFDVLVNQLVSRIGVILIFAQRLMGIETSLMRRGETCIEIGNKVRCKSIGCFFIVNDKLVSRISIIK